MRITLPPPAPVPRLAPLPRFRSDPSDGSVPTQPWLPDPPTLPKTPSDSWSPAALPQAPPQSAIPTVRPPRAAFLTPAKRAAIIGFAAGILGGAVSLAVTRIAHPREARPVAPAMVVAKPAQHASPSARTVRAEDLPRTIVRVEDLPPAPGRVH